VGLLGTQFQNRTIWKEVQEGSAWLGGAQGALRKSDVQKSDVHKSDVQKPDVQTVGSRAWPGEEPYVQVEKAS
jgi:hypothetical protein